MQTIAIFVTPKHSVEGPSDIVLRIGLLDGPRAGKRSRKRNARSKHGAEKQEKHEPLKLASKFVAREEGACSV
jgi:hypothetical protein